MQEHFSETSIHQIIPFNDNYYIVARQGDTFRSIGDDVHVDYRRLAKFNERDKDDPIEEGERIWLKKKRRHAPKEYKGYVYRVEAGDSMYGIAQHFGIRLKHLYKMNDQVRVADDTPTQNDTTTNASQDWENAPLIETPDMVEDEVEMPDEEALEELDRMMQGSAE